MIQLEQRDEDLPKASRPSLDDVYVRDREGRVRLLHRPIRSGKSTIIKLLLHEVTPTKGRVVVNGKDVTAMRSWKCPHFRRSIGCVFQDFRLLPNRTAYENVAFALEVIGKSKAVARRVVPEVLELVGLGGKEHRYPHELSGGEQQRVAVARAFVNRPLILLADEPTGNLDPDTSHRDHAPARPDQPHRHDRRDGHPRLQHREPDASPGRSRSRAAGSCVTSPAASTAEPHPPPRSPPTRSSAGDPEGNPMRAKYVLSEVLVGLWRNVTMTIAMIITMAVSLTMLGASLLLYWQVDDMKDFYYDKVEVSIFLKADVTDEQRTELQDAAEERPPGPGASTTRTRNRRTRGSSEQFQDAPDLVDAIKSGLACPRRSGSS